MKLIPISTGLLILLTASIACAATGGPLNVRDFGAIGDGTNLDSPAINKAIAAASQSGGGTVLVPAGTYLCGSLHLTNDINLCLDAGAVILGAPQELNAYDPQEEFTGPHYQDEGHTFFHNSLIWGEGLTNVSITGRGLIKGGGISGNDHPNGGGDKSIALKRCRNVLIRDITIFHGGHFGILATGCDQMTIDNVMMDTQRDGMDIDCCRDVMVSNCRINSPGDDGLCLKSSYALNEARMTENVTIVNCEVCGYAEGTYLDGRRLPSKNNVGRIKLGTESNGGFRNITINNCICRNSRGFCLEEVDGGTMDSINVANLTLVDAVKYPIFIRLGERQRAPEGTPVGKMRNIFLSNILATGVDTNAGVEILGSADAPIEGLRMQNVRMVFKGGGTREMAARVPPEAEKSYPDFTTFGNMPAYGFYIRHAKNIELSDVRLSCEQADARPPLMCVDVNGLEIENFKADTAAGVPPGRFEGVKNASIRNSPGLKNTAN